MLEDTELPDVYEVFFQFNDEEPIKFANSVGNDWSLRLIAEETNTPTISFTDGNGKEFKIFMR